MLHPKHNRIDYGEQLIPKDGYALSYAVATTYSLDLEALMILPVALFYAEKLDGNPDELRYDMLDAITKAADKITVYYQNGQLKVPKKYHHLMAYWEKGIQPVNMPGYERSFHPKVWIVRYEHKEEAPWYRVLVTSRNLTFARDWDVAFATDGQVTGEEQPGNGPLIHFLNYLQTAGGRSIPNNFLSDLKKVRFDLPDRFEALRFLPIGIPNPATRQTYTNPLTAGNTGFDDLLIVSPFLDKTTLERLGHTTSQKPALLSRKEEMDALDADTLRRFNCFQFQTYFENAEFIPELEDGGPAPVAQKLHAKLYIGMRQQTPYWYLGSANCSDPAQGRNVEFLVELTGSNASGLKTRDVLKSLTVQAQKDDIPLFTPYQYASNTNAAEQKRIDQALRKLKYDLTQLPVKGAVNQIEGGAHYNLIIDIDASSFNQEADFEVRVRPLPEQQKASVTLAPQTTNRIDRFGGYPETALSPYLVFEIWYKAQPVSQFLLHMDIDLPATRLNKIFTAIIDSRDKFLKYLTFLLTGEENDLILNVVEGLQQGPKAGANGLSSKIQAPVFEKLLIATSRFPEKLKAVDALVQRLKSESQDWKEPVITPEFESFWSVFQSFINDKHA